MGATNMKRIVAILSIILLALTANAVDFTAQVNELIPKLAAEDVGSRYEPQMQLQAIAANASKPGHETERAALGAVLAAKAVDASVPQPARVWIVRQIEYIGRGEAVASLASLLGSPDAELRECARRALEKNPDPKAADSLREALQKGGDAAWKIGLIRSLGEKRDAASTRLIAASLNDPQVGGAAAKALGQIASPEAIQALWSVINTQPLAAESLACAASRLNSSEIAARLYRQSNLSPIRAAALSVLAKTDPKALEEALLGNDLRLQKVAAELAPPATLVALLPKMPSSAKVFALRAIDTEKPALDCAADADESVRVAALEAMLRVGTAYSVPLLIKAAASGSEAEKVAAIASLARINGRGAAEAILRQAAEGESAARVAAINALAARAAKASVPALLQYAADSDAAVSKAALQAIAKLGSDESLDNLVKLVLAGRAGAKDALQAVANRSADKSAVGRKLAAQAQATSGPQLNGILEVMALVGGTEALDTVVKFASSSSDDVRDGAIRALCQWREFVAVRPLLEVAAAPNVKLTHQVLAIQAVCRLIRSVESEPAQARVEAALAALKAASRDQEKRQVLSALASIKDRKAADAILKLLQDPALKTDAAHAALSLADALQKSDRNSARKLAEAVKKADISPDLTHKADESLKKK